MAFLFIAIEGDVRHRLDEVATGCGFHPWGEVQLFPDTKSIISQLEMSHTLIAISNGGWTVVFSYHLTSLVFEHLFFAEILMKQFNARVIAALGDDTSCRYGFRIHASTGVRAVLVEKKVEQNIGEPIPGEPPVNEDYNEEDVLAVLKLLGIDFDNCFELDNPSALLWFGIGESAAQEMETTSVRIDFEIIRHFGKRGPENPSSANEQKLDSLLESVRMQSQTASKPQNKRPWWRLW